MRPNAGSLPLVFILISAALIPVALSYLAPEPRTRWLYTSATPYTNSGEDGAGRRSDQEHPIELPDSWRVTRPTFSGKLTYAFRFDAPDWIDSATLYIPRVSGAYEILVNGHVLGPQRDGESQVGSLNNVFLPLPLASLQPHDNLLLVRVTGTGIDRAGISQAYIGPRKELNSAFWLRHALQHDLIQLANWLIIAMALPLLLIWVRDPAGSRVYGLFAAGAMIFALRNFNGQITTPPLPLEYWRPLVAASLGWSAALIWIFLLRYSGFASRLFERAMVWFTAAGTLALFLVPVRVSPTVDVLAWRVLILLSGLFCVAVFARSTWRRPTFPTLLLLCGVLAQVAPAIHDLFWLLGVISFSSIQWFPLSFPVLLIFMALVLADDMANTKSALRATNADLEGRIAVARAELDNIYAERRKVELQAAHAEERHRLMREMHDGVGTHLSLLLSGLRSRHLSVDEVMSAVESTVDELQLMVDTHTADIETLSDALSNFRDRLLPRLAAAGVHTIWEISDDARDITLSTGATLHVLRIVQECVANAVRHGKARTITFDLRSCASPARQFELSIVDDGCGPDGASATTKGGGRGISNMKSRAAAINGSFSLSRRGENTVAYLSV